MCQKIAYANSGLDRDMAIANAGMHRDTVIAYARTHAQMEGIPQAHVTQAIREWDARRAQAMR